jgi:hypothetical protein
MKPSTPSTTSIASTAAPTPTSTSATTATARKPQSEWQSEQPAAPPAAPPARSVAASLPASLVAELAAVIARHLPPTPARAPGVTLSPREADQIAEALGLGTAPTAAAILTGIDRLASLRIGDIRIPFTPGQLAELQHRAMKRGRTVEAEIRAVVARLEDELFYQGG